MAYSTCLTSPCIWIGEAVSSHHFSSHTFLLCRCRFHWVSARNTNHCCFRLQCMRFTLSWVAWFISCTCPHSQHWFIAAVFFLVLLPSVFGVRLFVSPCTFVEMRRMKLGPFQYCWCRCCYIFRHNGTNTRISVGSMVVVAAITVATTALFPGGKQAGKVIGKVALRWQQQCQWCVAFGMVIACCCNTWRPWHHCSGAHGMRLDDLHDGPRCCYCRLHYSRQPRRQIVSTHTAVYTTTTAAAVTWWWISRRRQWGRRKNALLQLLLLGYLVESLPLAM